MSEETKKPDEKIEVVRKLVVPRPPSETEAGDRSPTKTERDLDLDAISKTKQNPTPATETVRKLVIPEE
ncbi:hypothetical protein [Stenomitos frigidus]|uniref:Uncharacterized protein n=1 Tax=Stenomitos frigidus ULC18 TaxID=2107698 RepID=A0A2T1E7J5_9CYAN|nr:hypothetical protein [Stenomitos frigidus]PSB28719.1 hypothetical protein C7B82_12770 [Stenomitos frigidus ULC18]